jgi:hypothetical protein
MTPRRAFFGSGTEGWSHWTGRLLCPGMRQTGPTRRGDVGRRVARTRAGNTWTESRFWSFIRSNLRLASRKWPPVYQALEKVRRPSQSKNKRLKWEFRCESCNKWFPRKEVEVDHIEPVGSLKCFDDLPGFVRRLFCEADGFAVLCKKKCHYNKTQEKK